MDLSLGQRIKLIRKKEAQDAFAVKIGISRGALSSYERDESQPSADTLQRICAKYGVEAEWLLLGIGPMSRSNQGDSIILPQATQPSERASRTESMRGKMNTVEEALQPQASTGQGVQTCSQCLTLYAKLEQANERLDEARKETIAAMREHGDLKEQIGKLKEELAALKNKQSPTATEQNPMASASGA